MKTEILNLSEDEFAIKKAAEILKSGGLVGMPTETVYGLAGNALDKSCVEKIFTAKGRPSDNPLIVHISHISQWAALVKNIPETALALAEKFWPGPLTIILEKSDLVPKEICGNMTTVAVRIPNHEAALRLIDEAGFPLAAPSANTSGKPSPTSAKHVFDDLDGKIEGILDAGECSVGVESTVLSLVTDPPRIFRPGGVTPEMLTEVLGEVEIDEAVFSALKEGQEVASPGTKYKHYSPGADVFLLKGSLEGYIRYLKENADEDCVALCFEGEEEMLDIRCITYGKKDDPSSQAKRIFDALRQVDAIKAKTAYVHFGTSEGVGLAVFNRLARAAGFKIIEV